ncbi:hypothetical protein V5799_005056 [Amblyomma americanum]|uniref:Uncharacterized protein n=1 Tax=Amblyomma americanum TaxID=6943 RepID=A0AAQ4D4C0_AMBAM
MECESSTPLATFSDFDADDTVSYSASQGQTKLNCVGIWLKLSHDNGSCLVITVERKCATQIWQTTFEWMVFSAD